MDGFTMRLFERYFNNPDVPEEEKKAFADNLAQAYGVHPTKPQTPEQAEAVKRWCPMGDS